MYPFDILSILQLPKRAGSGELHAAPLFAQDGYALLQTLDNHASEVASDNFDEIVHEYFVTELFELEDWTARCTDSIRDIFEELPARLVAYVRARVRYEIHGMTEGSYRKDCVCHSCRELAAETEMHASSDSDNS